MTGRSNFSLHVEPPQSRSSRTHSAAATHRTHPPPSSCSRIYWLQSLHASHGYSVFEPNEQVTSVMDTQPSSSVEDSPVRRTDSAAD